MDSEDVTSLASIIPELYYDLIASKAAGAPLITYFFWRTHLHQKLSSPNRPDLAIPHIGHCQLPPKPFTRSNQRGT